MFPNGCSIKVEVHPESSLVKEFIHPRRGSTFSTLSTFEFLAFTDDDIGRDLCVRIFYTTQTQLICEEIKPFPIDLQGTLES